MLRRCLLALVLALLVIVPTAQAGVKEEASAAVGRLLDASLSENYAGYCQALAPSFRRMVWGSEDCAAIAEALAESAAEAERDEAVGPLLDAYRGANLLAEVRNKGAYVSKKYTLKKLARDLHGLTEMEVKIAASPGAASGTSRNTVVLSSTTKAHRIVIYYEAPDGTIYRLIGTGNAPKLAAVGNGVPEPPVTVTYKVTEVGVADTGRAYVAVLLTATDGTESQDSNEYFLVEPVQGKYLVSEMLIPLGELIRSFEEALS